ncbi:ribonuclease BN [Flavipsychrobacter stenotrophus]|uniref:Ribonuclease BN n=1 Tax=Flavipsychrobacter stenotrophus TaxID=2077091 RepID=A0A2S7SRA5_9BACT|nr:YihY/virulence factor BrkB family protein [Flavipsychrobacter stenotrophus]PQJ09145.1 ribonuclease BN [Flavipsychrobacter stenotrophus]
MNIKKLAKDTWEILKNSFEGFSNDKVTKLGGSLAYSTVFSMGPLLVVIISLCGLFLGREAVEGKIYHTLEGFMGRNTAIELQDIIKKAALGGKSGVAVVIGSITLLIGATSVFNEIQDSINGIWGIKPKPKKGWVKMLQNRFLSFSVIISLGFVLLVSLMVTSFVDGFSQKLQTYFADTTVVIFYIINQLLTLTVVSLMFAVIFRVLPDAQIKWKDVIAGAVITAVLFMLGKFGISIYISKSNVGSTYGAAGSLVVLLLWVYYSSLILYFGAEFTKAYAIKLGSEIKPNHYAVTTKQVEIETGNASIQENDKIADVQKVSDLPTPKK